MRSQGLPHQKQDNQLVSLEPATVHVAGHTQLSDPSAAIRRVIKRREVEKFYQEELDWQKPTFDCVHWDELEDALSSKADLFRLWLTKWVMRT